MQKNKVNDYGLKIKEYDKDYIPSDVRDSIWEMEVQLAIMFSKKSRDCGVGMSVSIPTRKQLFFDDDSIKYVVCYKGKKIAGYISYREDFGSKSYDRSVIYIHNIYVLEEYRKQGIAKKLVKYIMDKYEGYYYQFSIMGDNEASLKLFKSVGLLDTKPLYSIYAFHTDYESLM